MTSQSRYHLYKMDGEFADCDFQTPLATFSLHFLTMKIL